MPAYQEAARAWIGNGMCALRTDGREGLQRYTTTVDEWIRKLRRRGDLDRVRLFLNMFSYQCKVAFYLCTSTAWVGILQRLSQTQQINTVGERFMQIWHHQNRAPDDFGVSRDALCGQVLAMHPLSGVVLTSPEHLTVVGDWIGHPDYEALHAKNQVGQCAAYWDLVATILIAAHEYDRSRKRWEEGRKESTRADSKKVSRKSRDDSTASERVLFEDFAAARGHVCSECSGTLAYSHFKPAEEGKPTATAFYRCQSCEREESIEVSRDDLAN
jgi:hypothetical protein